ERVRAKGDLSRHRTIMTDVPDAGAEAQAARAEAGAEGDASSLRSVDLETCHSGRVVRGHGLVSIVANDDGVETPCHARRVLKTVAMEGRNIIAIGDRVWYRPGGTGGVEGLIEKIEPRAGSIIRGYRRQKHVLVANVDQILIVSALTEPGLKLPLVDRYLIS